MAPASGGLFAQYTTSYREANLDQPHKLDLRAVPNGTRDETLAPALVSVNDKQFLVTRDPAFGFAVSSLPYGKGPTIRLGPADRLYVGWSDSLATTIYNLSGKRVNQVTLARSFAAPVTDADLDALRDSYPRDQLGEMSRAMIQGGIEDGQIPRKKPAFETFVVDGNGRVWFRVLTDSDRVLNTGRGLNYVPAAAEDDAEAELAVPWWIVDSTGRVLADARVPFNVALRIVQDGFAYGIAVDSSGVQSIVRYSVPSML
jgi:hypothetical protein